MGHSPDRELGGAVKSSISKPKTPAGKFLGTMKERPVVPSCVEEIVVVLALTRLCQSLVPSGMKAKRTILRALVNAPARRID
jgi:hypothetical protein